MSEAVLDASALLALVNDEPGGEKVAPHVPGGAISAVNLSEVVATLAASGMPATEIHVALDGLGLAVHPFDREQAYTAGLLRSATRKAGLGLGDRACLALAHALRLPALTTDATWRRLPVDATVRLIR